MKRKQGTGSRQWAEGLTGKQERFIDEYLIDLNATKAAIRAGYSAKTAHLIGHENLGKPEIQAALQAAQDARSRRTEITQDRVLAELARIGFGDLREVFDGAGRLKLPNELSDDAAARIASIEVVSRPVAGGKPGEVECIHKIRAWDKVAALVQLGRHLGMFDADRSNATAIVVNLNRDDSAL